MLLLYCVSVKPRTSFAGTQPFAACPQSSLVCYAFGPPPVTNRALSERLCANVYTVIAAHDAVPRLSVGAVSVSGRVFGAECACSSDGGFGVSRTGTAHHCTRCWYHPRCLSVHCCHKSARTVCGIRWFTRFSRACRCGPASVGLSCLGCCSHRAVRASCATRGK